MKTISLEILSQMANRDDIPIVLNECGLTGEAAEVGVLWGGFSAIVLKEWKGKVYYCVDTWEAQPKEVYPEKTEGIDYSQCYRQMQQFAEKDSRIRLLRGMSNHMHKLIKDYTLDWVFIDGNHSYPAVLEDMDLWFNKVKPGGILSGHDYGDFTEYPHWCEVKSAVDRWMKEHNIPFVLDRHGSSWWSIKP